MPCSQKQLPHILNFNVVGPRIRLFCRNINGGGGKGSKTAEFAHSARCPLIDPMFREWEAPPSAPLGSQDPCAKSLIDGPCGPLTLGSCADFAQCLTERLLGVCEFRYAKPRKIMGGNPRQPAHRLQLA